MVSIYLNTIIQREQSDVKRKHIGLMVGTFFIVAFITLIVATVLIAQKVMEDEQYKESYYATQYGLNQKEGSSVNTPVTFPSQSYTADPDSPQYKAVTLIRELHAQADYFLLGSKFSKYSEGSEEGWSDILKSELLKLANYEGIIETMSSEENIVKDMNNLVALIDIATTQYEPTALRFIHRILHDLDLYGYPDQSKTSYDYWGATYAVASSNPLQLDEINAYIAEKQDEQ
jgi:hypothetical protein